MMEWIAYQVPWWVWAIAALVVLALVHQFVGLRTALIAAGIAAVAIFHNRARQQGWQEREAKIAKDRAKAVSDRRNTDAEVDQMDRAGRDAEWDRWMRDR